MSIISPRVGKNTLEEMEKPSQSTEEPEMPYLDALSKTTEWSQFISKANHSMVSVIGFTVIQVYTPTSNAEEAEIEWFYEDL